MSDEPIPRSRFATSKAGKVAQGVYFYSFHHKCPPDLWQKTLLKITHIGNAQSFEQLQKNSGDNLKMLKGTPKGRYSIRVNDQYRICFTWNKTKNYAENLEFLDYHKG